MELIAIHVGFKELNGRHKDDELFVFQFFIQDVIQNLEGYFAGLATSGNDSKAQVEVRLPSVRMLQTWRPSLDPNKAVTVSPAAPVVEPVKVEPAPEVEKAEPQPVFEAVVPPAPVVEAAPVQEAAPAKEASAPVSHVAAAPVALKSHASASSHLYLMCKSAVTRGESASFAIPIQQVVQVIISQPIIALPNATPGYLGILNLRGETIPVLRCDDREEIESTTGKDYIVIATIEGKKFGFRMEQVLSVSGLDAGTFQESRDLLSQARSSWVTHLARKDDEIVLVMDLAKALVA
jgi:purine-binding chemotaxis protein CheW